jgi:hypothetical protein
VRRFTRLLIVYYLLFSPWSITFYRSTKIATQNKLWVEWQKKQRIK